MAQTNLTISIDEGIKQEAEILFNRIGLNTSSAIDIFFRQAINTQSIPFELKAYKNDYRDKATLSPSGANGLEKQKLRFDFVDVPPLPDSFFDPLPEEELQAWGL